MKKSTSRHILMWSAGLGITLLPALLWSQSATTPAAAPAAKSGLETALLGMAIALAVVIVIMSTYLNSAMKVYYARKKSTAKLLILAVLSMGGSTSLLAQPATGAAGLSAMGWVLIFVNIILIAILFFMFRWMRIYTGLKAGAQADTPETQSLWDKLNAFKPMSQERALDVGHDYDGIRELDNITPPWFTAAFLGTILFSIVYLYRYHVAHSAPLMAEEYQIEVTEAEAAIKAYQEAHGGAIDENNVVMLSEAADLEAGKTIFATNCVPCHGANGEGNAVGPNMTDDYYIHGGTVKDIFTTIKNGVPEKGMISWSSTLSSTQMAQVSSFLKSIGGTNVAGGKEPQGTLYKEGAASEGSVVKDPTMAVTTDTMAVAPADTTKK